MFDSLQRGQDKESFCNVLRKLVVPSEDLTDDSISKLIMNNRGTTVQENPAITFFI